METREEYMQKWREGVAKFRQLVREPAKCRHEAREKTMSECVTHELTFGPSPPEGLTNAWQIVSDKFADVADLSCPTCGAKLFIYYRQVPDSSPPRRDKGTP